MTDIPQIRTAADAVEQLAALYLRATESGATPDQCTDDAREIENMLIGVEPFGGDLSDVVEAIEKLQQIRREVPFDWTFTLELLSDWAED